MDHNIANQNAGAEFTPPRHWVGIEELSSDYWSDPKTKEKRGQEFYDKPIETIALIDRMDQAGIARRDFLTIMGASMAMASFACARRPVHKIIPYVVKPEEITPGVANYYASTCQECSSNCGILVKTREARPIKIEGNPDHPVSKGKLCARGQASVLNLYDTDRLTAPVKKGSQPTTWADADQSIIGRLKNAGAAGKVRVLSGQTGPTTRKLINEFLAEYKGLHVEFDPLAMPEIAEGQAEAYGTAVVPRYHFDRAEYVVSLGADFLGTWLSPVEHAADWAKTRKLDGKNIAMSKLVTFESQLSLTGANSDERFPVVPGDELKVALALLNELVLVQKRYPESGEIQAALAGYRAEKVAAEIGMTDGGIRIKKLANELWANRGKSLIVAGGTSAATEHAVALQVATNFLNSVLQNDGATIDGTMSPSMQTGGKFADMAKLIRDMDSRQVDVLVLYRSNPAYTLPKLAGFVEAMAKVPVVIAISDREDETAKLADFVLPDHDALENWGDAEPYQGLRSLQQPTIAPIHDTRAFQDTLLAWMSTKAGEKTPWHDYLKASWKEVATRQYGISTGGFEQFWETALRDGVFDGNKAKKSGAKSTARSFHAGSVVRIPKSMSPIPQGTLTLALYSKISMGDGRAANNAWLQELPDSITSMTWDNYLNLSPDLARKMDIDTDDVVEVAMGDQKVELSAHVQPGLNSGVVTMAIGYGRTAVGRVGNGNGVSVFDFAKATATDLVYSGHPVTVRKTGKVIKLASTKWHHTSENRPIINDITLTEYRSNPGAANHTNPELRLETVPSIWPSFDYSKGYRWGMAIDLSSCTGCSACVIACQSENNIPVVGRENVRVSRIMHWVRIDRYFSGPTSNPDLIFQPMLCQHCENAPCETVCPVLATVHNDEGLNEQIYNRCVGTRYCQNNCPYKVRRFNFFDHWKTFEGTMNLAWNPEVTVRTRGIMEKCSFCVQRIQEVKFKAKEEDRRVRDGEMVTACQQTCPTDAIVFGNTNDPESRVSKLKEAQRAFRVLETLNTKPQISYMTKVRNKEEAAGHSTAAAQDA